MFLFLDFDRTLYDLDQLITDMCSIWEQHGVPREIFHQSKKGFACHSGDNGEVYTARKHAENASLSENKIQAIEAAVERLVQSGQKYVFSGVHEFLVDAKKRGARRCILTFGDQGFQRLKVVGSGLDVVVDEVLVTKADKWEEIRTRSKGIKSAFVDDSSEYFLNPLDYVRSFHLQTKSKQCDCHAQVHVSALQEIWHKQNIFGG